MTKEQHRIYMREYYRTHKAKWKARVKRYKQANPDKVRQWNKEHDERRPDLKQARQARNHKRHYSERKERIKDNALQRLYGISLEDYKERVLQQNGLCAICNQLPIERAIRNGVDSSLCIDHDHATNRVREFLCSGCNLLVGQIEKNQHLLPTILRYLDKHK